MELISQLHDLAVLLPRKVSHSELEVICASQSVWMILKQEKYHVRAENRNRILCCSAQSFTITLTEVSQFPYPSACAFKEAESQLPFFDLVTTEWQLDSVAV